MNHDIVDLVEARIRDGRLPATHTFRTWGGLSSGARCVLCEQWLEIGECEIEVDWTDSRGGHRALLHPKCLGTWMDVLPAPTVGATQVLTGS